MAFLEVNPESRKLVISEKKASLVSKFANLKLGQLIEGEVLSVYGFSVGNPGVLIRHGKYISNYQNLSSIFVIKKEFDLDFHNQLSIEKVSPLDIQLTKALKLISR